MPAKPYSFRLAFPLHYAVTLGVALLILWGLTSVFGPTKPILIGWLVGFLISSRIVAWVIARRRTPK